MITNYRTESEKILTLFYKGVRNDDSNYSLRFVAQLVAEEMAGMAHQNAIENSNFAETTYSNDTFITTFKNITILTDSDLRKYIPLPSLPTALPNNQEIQKIWPVITNSYNEPTTVEIVPMSSRSTFAQNMLPSLRGFLLYYIEGINLFFDNPDKVRFNAVNVNMIGAMPDGELLDAPLTMSKNYEGLLSQKVIARLMSTSNRTKDIINDAVPVIN